VVPHSRYPYILPADLYQIQLPLIAVSSYIITRYTTVGTATKYLVVLWS